MHLLLKSLLQAWRRLRMKENDVDVSDLDFTIKKINAAIKERPDLASSLLELRKKIETMKVAVLELRKLRDDFERGNITTEDYLVYSKRLKLDLERARNEANLLDILDRIKDEEKRSKLSRLKDAIVSNKDFILVVLEILSAVLGKR